MKYKYINPIKNYKGTLPVQHFNVASVYSSAMQNSTNILMKVSDAEKNIGLFVVLSLSWSNRNARFIIANKILSTNRFFSRSTAICIFHFILLLRFFNLNSIKFSGSNIHSMDKYNRKREANKH